MTSPHEIITIVSDRRCYDPLMVVWTSQTDGIISDRRCYDPLMVMWTSQTHRKANRPVAEQERAEKLCSRRDLCRGQCHEMQGQSLQLRRCPGISRRLGTPTPSVEWRPGSSITHRQRSLTRLLLPIENITFLTLGINEVLNMCKINVFVCMCPDISICNHSTSVTTHCCCGCYGVSVTVATEKCVIDF